MALNPEIADLATDFKQQLTELYGSRFNKLILFGSYARGDFREDSDVDFMVVLNDEKVAGGREVSFVRKIMSNLSLEYNKLVSILPTNDIRFNESSLPFYKIVRKEGIKI
jgi:predicted nucleotidyltransferase